MLKQHKGKILLSSAVVLLPMLFGLLMWNDLPDTMITHWGADGSADGFGPKAFCVFGLPLILLPVHILCLLATFLDKRQAGQSLKALRIIFWIVPALSLFVSALTYCAAFGRVFDMTLIAPVLFGALFLFIGNYLPKTKQNKTLGIKLRWTLGNEENWNRTHRLAGRLWVIGGILLLLSVFLPFTAMLSVTVGVFAVGMIVPTVYSYCIYRQHRKMGIEYAALPKTRAGKFARTATVILVPIILAGTAVLMFTGSIDVHFDDASFTVASTYWTELEVEYSEIDSVEYRTDLDTGMRTYGFGSANLALGNFQNEEFGTYTLYAYTGADSYVVLTAGEKVLVIGLRDARQTQAIYNTLTEKADIPQP